MSAAGDAIEEAPAGRAAAPDWRRRKAAAFVTASLVLLVCACLLAVSSGSLNIPLRSVAAAALGGDALSPRDSLVMFSIRIPRVLMAGLVGAALAVSGALLQGLFRNPLADPGLVGVSSGAGLAAAATIVAGDRISPYLMGVHPFTLLPFGAFIGGLVSTSILYGIATRRGRTSVATMLLAGIALGALSGSALGFLSFLSDDRQLRDLTFWMLGSLGGATWTKVQVIAPILAAVLLLTPFLANGLNALLLGEAEAFYLGYSVQALKVGCIVLVSFAVGASVAVAGAIGFVGIVVPHLVRLIAGPDHRLLLPLSALLGATLLILADLVARLVVSPAELPIGIVTAAIGAPFFLWILLRRQRGLNL